MGVNTTVHKIVDFNRELVLKKDKIDRSPMKNPHKISVQNDQEAILSGKSVQMESIKARVLFQNRI